MRIQEIIIDESKPKELYCRGKYEYIEKKIRINSGCNISFDTYFNSFHTVKWNKYTEIKDINVSLYAKGRGKTEFFAVMDNSDIVALDSVDFNNADFKEISFSENLMLNNSFSAIYFTIKAVTDVEIVSACYTCSDIPKNNLNIACCFCTFKREKELTYNVRNILDNVISNVDSILYNHCKVFIADNGHTISSDTFNNDENVLIFQNPNYGGSAGFARCMIESCIHRKGEFTHIILMDDDAVIEPYVIERTALFLSVLKEEYLGYMIGGALLALNRPAIQHENGAVLDKLLNYDLLDTELDLTRFENVVKNSKNDKEVSYNGWWYTVIPASFVTESNLPLPLFIHYDDQEYGMRSNNCFIRLNGICAWHPEGKIGRPYMAYYDFRNKMIASAHQQIELSPSELIKQIIKICTGKAALYMYENSYYFLEGCLDFYKGIDSFISSNTEELNDNLRKKRNYKSYKSEKSFNLSKPVIHAKKEREIMALINIFLPPVIKYRAYDCGISAYDINYFFAKRILLVDKATNNVTALEKKYFELFKVIILSLKTSLIVLKNHNNIYSEWVKKSDELTTYNYWIKYLNLTK